MTTPIEINEIKGFRVIRGLNEIGTSWTVQARKILVYTYGCKIYCNGTLEAQFPEAKATPWAYELKASASMTWHIERTGRTWVDQTVKEIFASSVGGANVYSASQDAILTRNGDPYVYKVRDSFFPQAAAVEALSTSGASPLSITLSTTEQNVRVEGIATTITSESVLVEVLFYEVLAGVPYIFAKYWDRNASDLLEVSFGSPVAQVDVRVSFKSLSGIADLAIQNPVTVYDRDNLFALA